MLSPTVSPTSSLKRGPLNDRISGGVTDWGLKINTEQQQQQTTTPCACSSACCIHCCGVSQIRTKNRSLGAARVNDQPGPGVPSICRRMPGLDRSTTTTTTKASFTSGERSHQWFDWPSQNRTEPDSELRKRFWHSGAALLSAKRADRKNVSRVELWAVDQEEG